MAGTLGGYGEKIQAQHWHRGRDHTIYKLTNSTISWNLKMLDTIWTPKTLFRMRHFIKMSHSKLPG